MLNKFQPLSRLSSTYSKIFCEYFKKYLGDFFHVIISVDCFDSYENAPLSLATVWVIKNTYYLWIKNIWL